MTRRLGAALVAAVALALLAAAPAGAASVAYIDGHNLWLSSPDGAQKVQVTTGGTEDAPWNWPSQGPDGKTVVVHNDTFDSGRRQVLYLYGANGSLLKANVMPRYSGATAPVYPIGLDMDWNSNAVAYGYSYCGFACNTLHRGYWLTFSDNQGAYPTNPQGASDAYNPTFYGTRVISSDSGGNIFVQPDVPEAPFTHSYQGWLQHAPGFYLSRAEASPTGSLVAIEWLQDGGAEGIVIARHEGVIPSDLGDACDLPAAGASGNLTFSPDGTQMAWKDDEGVKVAGVPNLAAGTGTCTLTAPVRVISPTGRQPHFGGANVSSVRPGTPGGGGGGAGGGGGGGGSTGSNDAVLQVSLAGKATRAAFARGLTFQVQAAKSGRIDASASISARDARRARLGRGRGASAARIASKGFATASAVVVARGRATASGAGAVTVRLRPTKPAKRAAKRLRKVVVTVKVSQGAASGTTRIRLR